MPGLGAAFFGPNKTEEAPQPTQAAATNTAPAYVHPPGPLSVEELLDAHVPADIIARDRARERKEDPEKWHTFVVAVQTMKEFSSPSPPGLAKVYIEDYATLDRRQLTEMLERRGYLSSLIGAALSAYWEATHIAPVANASIVAEARDADRREAAGLRPDANNPRDPWVGQASPSPLPSTTLNATAAEHHRQRPKGVDDAPAAEPSDVEMMRAAYDLRQGGESIEDVASALRLTGRDRLRVAEALISSHGTGATSVSVPGDIA